MLELKVNVPEVRSYLNGIVKSPGKMFDIVQYSVQSRSKQYEASIREDLSLMFLSGVSTWTLSLVTTRLVGRKLSHAEVSKVN